MAEMVVVIGDVADCLIWRAWQTGVLEQDAVLEGLVPTRDLALSMGLVRGAADMVHALVFEQSGQIPGDVTAAIVAEQARPRGNRGTITAGSGQSILQRRGRVRRRHRGAQSSGDDVAAVVVEDLREGEPAPADDLEVGEMLPAHRCGASVGGALPESASGGNKCPVWMNSKRLLSAYDVSHLCGAP